MKSIKEFVTTVTFARKRTGLILLTDVALLDELKSMGIKIADLAEQISEHILISDDELIHRIIDTSIGQSTAILNLELFLAPRFSEPGYLNFLLSKLAGKEPLKPIFLVFYSPILFELFKNYYIRQKQTENHYFDEL